MHRTPPLQPEDAYIDELTNYPAEGWIRCGHVSSFGTVDRSYKRFSRFHIRARFEYKLLIYFGTICDSQNKSNSRSVPKA